MAQPRLTYIAARYISGLINIFGDDMSEIPANNSVDDQAKRLQFMERKLDIFETKMNHLTDMLTRVVEKMDGHYVSKQEHELRMELIKRDVEKAEYLAKKVHDEIEWLKRGVLSAIGGVFILFVLKVLPLTGGVLK